MSEPLPVSLPLRTSALGPRKPRRFDLVPDEAQRNALARILGISSIPKLRFTGELRPTGRNDIILEARLQATVVQPCIISLAPVVTELQEVVKRSYRSDFKPPADDDAEMPEDDTEEPLPDIIDPGAVMTEALALALPDYPRAPGAVLGETVHAAPGIAPLRDSDLRPFAGLAGLAGKLAKDDRDET